jgi:hypothetical protein
MVGFADSKTNVAKFAVVVPKAGLSKIPNAFTGRLLDAIGPIFDCKQQRLMYILQNQNDCPRLDHLQLNCNLYHRIKKHNTRHY